LIKNKRYTSINHGFNSLSSNTSNPNSS
jgi:hypothetical protein